MTLPLFKEDHNEDRNEPVYRQGLVWCERNLMRYPLAILACLNFQELLQNSIKTGVSLTYEYTDGDKRRVWKLTPHIELGYPGAFDKDVLITIQKLVTDAGFPPPNPFALPSFRQICKLMGIAATGQNMKAIKTSFKRWAFTGIETNSFYLKDQDRYWEGDDSFNGAVFTIWSVYWKGKRLPNGSTAERTYLYFNPPFYLSLLAFYMQPLDFAYYMELPPLAKRIYELQAPKFFGLKDSKYTREEYVDYCRRLPIVPQKYFSLARRVLDRAHGILKHTGFLSRVEWEGSSYRKPWFIKYYPGPRALAEIEQAKERLRRLEARQRRLAAGHAPVAVESPETRFWVEELYQKLEASRPGQSVYKTKNRAYYEALARLIVRGKLSGDLVRELLSEAFYQYHQGRITKSRSAFFTDLLKRHLVQRGQDLKGLLRQA
jgi:hypothetical protein